MLYTFKIFLVLAILFIVAIKSIDAVYNNGKQIPSFLVGGISFLCLILGQIFLKNQILLTISVITFLFGSIVFFMSATRNYKLLINGEGNGWLAKRVRKLKNASKNHS